MTKTIYASELGHCYGKLDNYRAYKDGGIYAIYMVGKELIWNADNTDFKVGTRLEAVQVGYIQDIRNFEVAVEECKFNTAQMMKEAI
jgi:hypothetical protein